MNNFSTPSEIADFTVNVGVRKANLSVSNQFVLGILAGAFIAFGAQASNIASHTIADISTAKLNSLMIMALADKKITLTQLLRSWLVVYLGNFAGSLLIAWLISGSGQLNYTGGLLGGFTIKAAAGKVSLPFTQGVILGVLCNWLVCLAVWMSFGAKDGVSKAVCVFFPIWLFVASGFEHSIANMYYIPAGILAKCSPLYVAKAIELGVSQQAIDSLSWSAMFSQNLLPVTLGNILGGAGFVGCVYWLIYRRGR